MFAVKMIQIVEWKNMPTFILKRYKGGDFMANSLLPQRLKELRKVNNYTQDYVAEALGTTRQTYSHYETGRRKPSPETIYKLALLYNVSADDLLHLSIEFDEKVFYEAPGPSQSSEDLAAYLEYFNDPKTKRSINTIQTLKKSCYTLSEDN